MGWLIVIAWEPLTATLPIGGVQLLIAGGLLYTFGASVLRMACFSISSCSLAYICISWFGSSLFCCVTLCDSALKTGFRQNLFFYVKRYI